MNRLIQAQMDEQSIRLYAISSAILNKRKSYYEVLEKAQKNDSNITGLFEKECIIKLEGGGRNTRYQINTQL